MTKKVCIIAEAGVNHNGDLKLDLDFIKTTSGELTHWLNELKSMISGIRLIEKALGREQKFASESEKKNIPIARRSSVANTKIKKGQFFTEKNVICKRPGGGLNPMLWPNLIGKIADRDYSVDDPIVFPKN